MGLVAAAGHCGITQSDIAGIAQAGFAGLVFIGPNLHFDDETACLRTADELKLFIIEAKG